jgi:CheY-like chemotaxis protein
MAATQRCERFSVVITDLGMPHVDGRTVAAAIKAASPTTPVVMLTGWGHRLQAENDLPEHVDQRAREAAEAGRPARRAGGGHGPNLPFD